MLLLSSLGVSEMVINKLTDSNKKQVNLSKLVMGSRQTIKLLKALGRFNLNLSERNHTSM